MRAHFNVRCVPVLLVNGCSVCSGALLHSREVSRVQSLSLRLCCRCCRLLLLLLLLCFALGKACTVGSERVVAMRDVGVNVGAEVSVRGFGVLEGRGEACCEDPAIGAAGSSLHPLLLFALRMCSRWWLVAGNRRAVVDADRVRCVHYFSANS